MGTSEGAGYGEGCVCSFGYEELRCWEAVENNVRSSWFDSEIFILSMVTGVMGVHRWCGPREICSRKPGSEWWASTVPTAGLFGNGASHHISNTDWHGTPSESPSTIITHLRNLKEYFKMGMWRGKKVIFVAVFQPVQLGSFNTFIWGKVFLLFIKSALLAVQVMEGGRGSRRRQWCLLWRLSPSHMSLWHSTPALSPACQFPSPMRVAPAYAACLNLLEGWEVGLDLPVTHSRAAYTSSLWSSKTPGLGDPFLVAPSVTPCCPGSTPGFSHGPFPLHVGILCQGQPQKAPWGLGSCLSGLPANIFPAPSIVPGTKLSK